MQSKNVNVEDDEKLSYKRLEQRNYRSLQQLAKSLGLPSNFKKVYLVELIHAKKYKSDADVNNIIHRVKLERLQLSRSKRENQRKRMQYTEHPSSSRTLFSPPITHTPKRPGHMHLLFSAESTGSLNTHNPKKNLMHTLNQNSLSSDRVLRSFNMKTVKPNYALLSGQEIKPHSTKETRIEIITNGGFGKYVVKKHKPNILNSSLKRPLMLDDRSDLLSNPTKCRKTLTNLCPLVPDTIPKLINSTQNVWLRKNDGSVTKLNAIIQKRHIDIIPKPKTSFRNTEINTQNVINTIGDDLTHNILTECNGNDNYFQIHYPNVSTFENNNNENSNMNAQIIENNLNNNNLGVYSVYYHKKIRSEQIRFQKFKEMENGRLPTISEVFSRFNNINRIDFSQPLYVQVSTESERSQSHPIFSNGNQYNSITLETVYNFKSNVSNAPLLQIATTCKTECVYSTPTITTPIEQPSTIVTNEAYISYDRSHEVEPRLHEFLQFPEQNSRRNYSQHEDFNASTSSLETSQDLSTATLPEMVEDALELISQDGDYMDQITIGMRVQCVFCSWAGPKIILENHIRKEHASYIERQSASTWSVTCSLESISAKPLLRLVEHNAALYLLRAVYENTDCLVATLNSLSKETEVKIGSITIYNRISGEPFSWSGQIQPAPPNFVYETDNCLQIELSRLDLLPNSANLRLLNRELVSDCPIKAVVGQPALSDIHLILFVKIFN